MSPCLPSGAAAIDFVRAPSPQTAIGVVGTMLLRGTMAGIGLYLAGARDKELVRYTVAATSAIEASVLVWAMLASR